MYRMDKGVYGLDRVRFETFFNLTQPSWAVKASTQPNQTHDSSKI